MLSRTVYNKFNRGELDPLALARDDVTKVNNSAAHMDNWLPIRLGPMMFRPGLEHVAQLRTENEHFLIPFVRSIEERAILAFQDKYLAFYVIDEDDNVTLSPGDNSTTTISNGAFTSDLTGWTDDSGGSATTAWTADKNGCASLVGTDSAEAVLYQTLSGTDTGAEHVLRVVVKEAPVTIRLGTSGSNSADIYEGTLGPGVHYLNFTPASNVTITFANDQDYRALVGLVDFPSSLLFAFDYSEFDTHSDVDSDTIRDMKWVQSGDIIYFALDGVPQFQVERRSANSWSVVTFRCDDGPFGSINTSDVTLEPGALTGNTTLTASRSFFSADSVDRLFKVTSSGQFVTATITAEDSGTNSIRVFGVDAGRAFRVTISNPLSTVVTMQRSTDDATWEDVQEYTTETNELYSDEIDNAVFYYRLWVKTGDYDATSPTVSLDYPAGSIDGICRVTGYTSATEVDIQVLKDFGGTDASANWYASQWSRDTGYPSATEIYEGRLCFGGKSQFWASVSDAYDSFDRDIAGDSQSIYRTIGFGPTDRVNWLKRGLGLIMGILSDEISIRSSSFGEVLTNFNTNLRSGNTRGSSSVPPERSDRTIYFSHLDNKKIYALNQETFDSFKTEDMTILNPSICSAGVRRIAITRQPETRAWIVMDDGTMRVMLIEPTENVLAWSRFSTDGDIKDVVSVRGVNGPGLYFVVKRGSDYFLESLASIEEAQGNNISKHYDAFLHLTNTSSTISVSDSPALVGRSGLAVWADGEYRGTFDASGSNVTLGASYDNVVIGIPYTANYTSNKLMGYTQGSVLNERRRVTHIGFVARNMWYDTLKFSGDGTNYQNLPIVERGTTIDTDSLIEEYDEPPIPFPGGSKTDPRVYLQATGPATIQALTYEVEFPDRSPTQ